MAQSNLIDRYLPLYSFKEYHETVIKGSIGDVYEKVKHIDLAKSHLIRWLFKIRGLPTQRMHLQDFISDIGFTVIEENSPTEILIGFWAKFKIEPIPSPQDFLNNTISPRVKVLWNFYLEELAPDQVRLSTETRVLCVTKSARVTFGLYWILIKPFSGITRNEMLRIIKQDCEIKTEPGSTPPSVNGNEPGIPE